MGLNLMQILHKKEPAESIVLVVYVSC